ncbi:MAG: hypothetical protein QXR76_03360 [Candidatus Bathyarchaeia archaeon]
MSHWRKLDHVAFLLMFPFIFAVVLYPSLLFSMGDRNLAYVVISMCGLVLFALWCVALAYDIEESKMCGW